MMAQQADQELAYKSTVDQEDAINLIAAELCIITGGGKENANQGAKTGAVVGAWMGAGYLGYQGGKHGRLAGIENARRFGEPRSATVALSAATGAALGTTIGAGLGAGLGAVVGSTIGATFPDPHCKGH